MKKITPEKLRETRIGFGLSLVELSKMTGISKSSLNYMENGLRPIPKDMVNILKCVLKKKLSELKIVVDNVST